MFTLLSLDLYRVICSVAVYIDFESLFPKQKKGRYLGANIGLGYLQRIYNIDTYELNANGEAEEIGGGQGQFMTSLSVVFGQDLSYKNDSPLSWHVKPTLLFLSPYTHTTVPNAALEVGVTYKLGK